MYMYVRADSDARSASARRPLAALATGPMRPLFTARRTFTHLYMAWEVVVVVEVVVGRGGGIQAVTREGIYIYSNERSAFKPLAVLGSQ